MNNAFSTAEDGNSSPHAQSPLGPLKPVANLCTSGQCPTVYTTESGASLVVQGYPVAAERAGMDVPAGEMLIEIPRELLLEAARNLS